MTFLKKLGSILLKATEVVTGFAPMAQMLLPGEAGAIQTVSHDLSQIANIVVQVETIGQALGHAGPDKLKAAAPLVAQVVMQSTLLVGHKINDAALFQKACAEIASGMADLLNSLKDNIDTESKA